jgi:hypothetical protein
MKEETMSLPEKYRSLSRQQLLEKAFDLGVCFEKYSGSCSQCIAAALREILPLGAQLILPQGSQSALHYRAIQNLYYNPKIYYKMLWSARSWVKFT